MKKINFLGFENPMVCEFENGKFTCDGNEYTVEEMIENLKAISLDFLKACANNEGDIELFQPFKVPILSSDDKVLKANVQPLYDDVEFNDFEDGDSESLFTRKATVSIGYRVEFKSNVPIISSPTDMDAYLTEFVVRCLDDSVVIMTFEDGDFGEIEVNYTKNAGCIYADSMLIKKVPNEIAANDIVSNGLFSEAWNAFKMVYHLYGNVGFTCGDDDYAEGLRKSINDVLKELED